MEISFSQWMFSAWVKPDALSGIQALIDEGGGTNGVSVRLNGSTLEAAVRNGGSGSQTNAGTLTFPSDGAWHHVMCVFDNGNFTLYLDGVAGTTSVAGFSTVNAHSGNGGLGWTDGGSGFGGSTVSYFSGLMDDVRYYYEMSYTTDQIADLGRNDGDRNNLTAGTYNVTVTSATGCTSVENITIVGGANFTDGGTIQADENGCGSFDPAAITNVTSPSGGNGGTTEYQWEYRTDGAWTVIPSSNADSYDPALITVNTQYRRGARRAPCTNWVYSNIVSKYIVSNKANGGSIDGDESACGSYDPEVITNLSSPGGGSGGTLEYQWQESIDNGATWTDVSGATSETYDPGVITQTTQFKRGARLSPCLPWIYSNVATKTVIINYTDPGVISGDEENCNSYDPTNIANIIAPSGGGEGSLEYQWEQSIDYGNTWTDIVSGTSESFDPSFITQTTYYRRKARRSPCSAWITSNTVIKTVVINFTNSGSISGNESNCGDYNPSIISSSTSASGGSDGTTQYQWEISTDNSNWSDITGANLESYDPPSIITQTTYYRRKARRLSCLTWINSGTVAKEVLSVPTATITTHPTSGTGLLCEGTSYIFEAANTGVGASYSWDFGSYATPSSATGRGPHNVTFDVPNVNISYNVTIGLTVDIAGCIDNDQVNLDIRPNIIITNISHTNPSSCSASNGTIDITATYPTGSDVEVSLDGGTTWNAPGVLSFNGLSSGIYDIRVRYDNGDCEISYGNVTLTDPAAPTGFLTVSADTVCMGSSIIVQATATSGSPSITWNFGVDANPATATGAGPHTISYTSSGAKSVVATLDDATCQLDLDTMIINVDNFVDGGSIDGDEAMCGTTDPTIITNAGDPSGGNYGTIQYQWQESTDGNDWIDIAGATSNSYNPGVIAQTTFYRRKARRNPCGSWQFSNEVQKVLTSAPVATDDYFDSACPGIVYVDNVANNDNNLMNTTFTVTVPPSNGTVDIDHDGEFFYIPGTTFCGTDQFTYEVCNEGSQCCTTGVVVVDLSDAAAPSLSNIPSDITVHCDEEMPNPSLVNAVENCQSVTLGLAETSTKGADTCSVYQYTLTRTWTAVDYCGNNIANEQNIHVRDVTAPNIYRVYTMTNGKKLVGGVMKNTTHRWKTISFPVQFGTKPIVFAQVVSENETSTVIARVRNISTTQFQVQLQEQEDNDDTHTEEDVAWIAIEPGSTGSIFPFDAGSILASSANTPISFNENFAQSPAFIAMLQTNNESNPATIRYNSVTNSGANVMIEEELSLDPETAHGFETVGYVAFENEGFLINSTAEIFGEVGTLTASATSQTINLQNAYHNPVVVFGGVSQNEMTPVTISVNNLTLNSFDVRIKEWDYEDDNHTSETISYMVIEGSIPFNRHANCDAIPVVPQLYSEIRAVDNCDQSIAITYTQDLPNFDCITDTIVYRTWYVEDECGNSNSYQQQIILRDTTPPTFTVPADITVICGTSTDPIETGDVIDEADNCSSGLNAVYTDNLGNLNGCLGYYERIWTLTDFCGNETIKYQKIYIEDPDDTDGDGKPNPFDHDDDNDGIPDVDETSADLDGDGIPNDLDLDSDNDGIPDIVEAGFSDINGDGVVDNVNVLGWDDDGDGFADGYDADDTDTSLVRSDNFEPTDFAHDRDGDGIMNLWDLDSDNDGIPDLIEAGGVDTDGNGIIDYPIPSDPTSMEDGDGDGFVDIYDADDDGLEFAEDVLDPLVIFTGSSYRSGTPSQNPDTDYDGIPDFWDLDSDNDSAPDLVESGGVDENGDGRINPSEFVDVNGDGMHDDYTSFPLITTDGDGLIINGRPEDTNGDGSPFNGPNPDKDGLLNHRDLDSDGDGITDIYECGNLTLDNDRDGDLDSVIDLDQDGFDDNQAANPKIKTDSDGSVNDGRPEDDMDADNSPYSSSVLDGTFGEINGEPDVDQDADGILNLADIDSDNDLILDKNEDKNGNGVLDPGERNYLDRDTDNDLIIDGIEDANQDGDFDEGETDPLNPDTDYDSLHDGTEDANQDGDVDMGESDPRDPCDPNPTSYCLGITLDLRVKLQGAMIDNNGGGLMRDDLRNRSLIPTKEPYEEYEYLNHVGEGGGEEIDPTLFDITGGDAVVDWVLIELRAASRADSLVATRSAILQRDGDIVDIDGVSNITFQNMPSGNYYVALRHRNHLGIITSNTHFLSPNPTEIDFTNTATDVYGDVPLVEVNGERYMWAGDLNQDRQAVYQGPSNDVFDMFLKIMLDSLNDDLLVNFVTIGYYPEDLNLDGSVIYQGPNNDRSRMLFNVTLKTPENSQNYANFVVGEDLPENDNGTANDPCLTGATDPACDFDQDGIINQTDLDDDNDGVSDLNDVDPYDPESDSDEDGLSDNYETQGDGAYNVGIDTNPLSQDTDNDSVRDDVEDANRNRFVDVGETDPLNNDTDGDGLEDGEEDLNSNGILDPGETSPIDKCDPYATFLTCDFDGDGFPNVMDLDDDNDGVSDDDDVDDFDPMTDSDGDGIDDITETGGDGVYNPLDDSNPLDACDPSSANTNCIGIDADGDGYFENYPADDDLYDNDDNDPCIPDFTVGVCDFDEDLVNNDVDTDDDNDGVNDTNDIDPYDPESDSDFDGITDNTETGGDGSYDPGTTADTNPLEACDPNPNHANCIGIDADADSYFANYPTSHTAYDPDDNNQCVPDPLACGTEVCDDVDGDGMITICHNGNTTQEISVNDWNTHSGHGDYCGPCRDYYTVAPGQWSSPTTWENGDVPPYVLNGENVIINHPVTVQNDINIQSGGNLWVEDATFAIQLASLNINDGSATFINSTFDVTNNIQMNNTTSDFNMEGGSLNVSQSFINNGGSRFLKNVYVTIQNGFKNQGGTDELENTCVEITNGDFKNSGSGSMTFNNFKLNILNGSLINDWPCSTSGNISAVWVQSGWIWDTGNWNADIDHYCVNGLVLFNIWNNLPPSEECNDIATYLSDCATIGSGSTDNDGDGYFGNVSPTNPLFDSNDSEACIPNPTSGNCTGVDNDSDSYFGNYPTAHPQYDSNDNNDCVPDNSNCGGGLCEDIDGDGFLTICHNGTTQTITVSEWDSYNAQGANCGPCADYRTIANGLWSNASTWQGGNVPPTNLSGEHVIINHTVTSSAGIAVDDGSHLWVENGSLTINGGWKDLYVKDGSATFINSTLDALEDLELDHSNARVVFLGGEIILGKKYVNYGGRSYFENLGIDVDDSYEVQDGGIDKFVDVCLKAGSSHIHKIKGHHGTELHFTNTKIHMPQGKFDSHSDVFGTLTAVWIQNGDFKTHDENNHPDDVWQANVLEYCVSGTVNISNIYLPATENCPGISGLIGDCSGGGGTGGNVDDDMDGYFANFSTSHPLFDSDDNNACIPNPTHGNCDFDGDSVVNSSDSDDDGDGVADTNDVDPYDEDSDSDSDGVSDNTETGGDGVYDVGTDSDPLDPCDPNPASGLCDFDGDSIVNDSDNDDDNDGVADVNDVDDYNINSDSDGDGITDDNENGNDGTYNVGVDTNPLEACDPNPANGNCVGIDGDSDGYFANYPSSHGQYDPIDNNECVPDDTGCNTNGDCSDLDGDGYITVCQGGTTQSILVSTWNPNANNGDYCGPCGDYKTIANGSWSNASTWEGGLIPPTTINGETVIVNHDVNSGTITVKGNGYLWVENGGLDVTGWGAKISIENGEVTFINSAVTIAGDLNLINSSSKLTIVGGSVDVNDDFRQDGGESNFVDVCMDVRDNFNLDGGTQNVTNTCLQAGTYSWSNFSIASGATWNLTNAKFWMNDGNVTNNGTVTGNFTDLWVHSGSLTENGTWTANIDKYCVSGTMEVSGTYLPASEDCARIADAFMTSCDCFDIINNGTDNDGDGYFENYNNNDPLYDPDDNDICTPNVANCVGIDNDSDGYFGNYPNTHPQFDPNDDNDCIPSPYGGCPILEYETIASGDWSSASTWLYGNVPPQTVDGILVTINHDVTVQTDHIEFINSATLQIENATLTINDHLKFKSGSHLNSLNADFVLNNGNFEFDTGATGNIDNSTQNIKELKVKNGSVVTIENSNITMTKFLEVAFASASLTVNSSTLNINEEVKQDGGFFRLDNVCLEAGEYFQAQNGITEIVNSNIQAGLVTNGYFKNFLGNNMTITDSNIRTKLGDFTNDATLTGSGTRLWVESGDIDNMDNWTCDIVQYCVSGSINIPSAYKPNWEFCWGISGYYPDCD